MPPPILKSIMGHADLRSIMKYVHTAQEQMDREMLRIDAAKDVVALPGSGPVATGQNREAAGIGGNIQERRKGQPKLLN